MVPHVAFIYAWQNLFYTESVEIDASFDETHLDYQVQIAVISLTVNFIVYLIAAWYLDQVFPNEWGAKKHPCFCFCE